MIVAHSDDDELGDQRIIYVPAQDHEQGSMWQVFKEHYRYPRIVTYERGPNYAPATYYVSESPNPVPDLIEPIGFIPQVKHT